MPPAPCRRLAKALASIESAVGGNTTDWKANGALGTAQPLLSGGVPEFPASTRVYYVNGIRTDARTELADARSYATQIHETVNTIHGATRGTIEDIAMAGAEREHLIIGAPERAVARETLKAFAQNKDIHFMAHSRGALVVEDGLLLAQAALSETFDAPTVRAMMSRVGVETIGGASPNMPDGVRCVSYINPNDIVANTFGRGVPTLRDDALLAAILVATPPVLENVATAKFARSAAQGPVIQIPTVSNGNDPASIMANHEVGQYLAHRVPFEKAYAAWERTQSRVPVPHPQPLPAPVPSQTTLESVQQAQRNASEQGTQLPIPVAVDSWDGKPHSGSFLRLDDDRVAQHVGRGTYQVYDVQKNLHGIEPPLLKPVELNAQGVILKTNGAHDQELQR